MDSPHTRLSLTLSVASCCTVSVLIREVSLYLEKFCLPSYRFLCYYIQHIKFTACLNISLFTLLEIKISQLDPLDKICAFCLDEMSLKTNLFYDYSIDSTIGIEDNGDTRSSKPASSVTVAMIRNKKSEWE